MSAYVLAQIQIDDPEEYQNYMAGFMPIFERHGGKLLATSKNQTIVIEGSWAYPSTVVMKFSSVESAQAWCDDPDYKRSQNIDIVLPRPISSLLRESRRGVPLSPKETLKSNTWLLSSALSNPSYQTSEIY